MKFTLLAPLALALLLAPRFALAQTATTGTIAATDASAPFAVSTPQQLLDHLFDSYGEGKTFTATFDVSLSDGKPQPSTPLNIHLKVARRAQASSVKVVGTLESEGNTDNFQLLDDGRDANFTYAEQGGHKDALELLPQFTETLQALFDKYGKLTQFADFSPLSLEMKFKGEPTFTLNAKDKNGHTLRAVVDAKTRALLSLEMSGAYSVRVSDQSFDAPIPDSEFEATQVADFRHANPNSMTLIVPSLLSDDDDAANATQPTPSK